MLEAEKEHILDRAGYHFLDVAAGLVLASVLLLIGMTSYAGLSGDQALKFEARRLKAVLEQLTIDALQREIEIVIEFDEHSYCARKKSGSGGVLLRHELKRPVRVEAAAKETPLITFFPSGVSTPATVILSDGKNRCRVVLSLRSRVNMRCG